MDLSAASRAHIEEARRQVRDRKASIDPIPAASPPLAASTRLTVGMATYDDFDGAWFTIASIVMHHPEVLDQVSFVIVDNNPTGPHSPDLKALDTRIPRLRYVPFRGYRGTSVRDVVFREAQGDIVLCLDSHVLVRPGGLRALLDYFDANPGSRDLVQGPLLRSDLHSVAARGMTREWGGGMFGKWENDSAVAYDAAPYDIDLMGLGLFACRRQAWPGLHPLFRGFGGEEGYLHEKVRRAGGRTIGLPALAWAHRFERPAGVPYPNTFADRIRNYELGWAELGWDLSEGRRHFREIGASEASLAQARAAVTHPLASVDGLLAINLAGQPGRWAGLLRRTRAIDVDWRLERIDAVPTPDNHHVGLALSYRAAIEQARRRGWRSVLVLEDDVVFRDDALAHLGPAMSALFERDFDLAYLGVPGDRGQRHELPDTPHLKGLTGATSAHAVIISERAFDRLLDELPDTQDAMRRWIDEHLAIDQWFARGTRTGELTAFIVEPQVASQEVLLHPHHRAAQPDPEHFPLI